MQTLLLIDMKNCLTDFTPKGAEQTNPLSLNNLTPFTVPLLEKKMIVVLNKNLFERGDKG